MASRLIQVTRTVKHTYYVRVTDVETTAAARKKALAVVDEWGDSNDPVTTIGNWTGYVCDTDAPVATIHATVSAFVPKGQQPHPFTPTTAMPFADVCVICGNARGTVIHTSGESK